VGKLFDLAVEASKGEIVGTLFHAESAEQARAFRQDLFPGCNVMAVCMTASLEPRTTRTQPPGVKP